MSEGKLQGLFVNCPAAQDSIFESGKMAFDCLEDSENFSLDYTEISRENREILGGYDFYLFNYHFVTMPWLDAKSLGKHLDGLKITLVLEVSPNDPFVFCDPDAFDAYCVLDPTLGDRFVNAYAFPRPLETMESPSALGENDIPVIGTFGFATAGKGFEQVVEAVSREFERAVVRINIPSSNYADQNGEFAGELAENCRRAAKNGVEVIVTHDFMTKPELIEWCGKNTLNCFLYDRNMPGLSATTDQAISSGRPLLTSKNNTFRHIQKYIKPFPYQSLTGAIEKTGASVAQMQNDWSPQMFRRRFEEVLGKFEFSKSPQTIVKNRPKIILPLKKERDQNSLAYRLQSKIAVRTRLEKWRETTTARRQAKAAAVSYSQFGEDKIIVDLLNGMKIQNVRYLDIGANNPKYISNTFALYESGLSGVLVEPNRVLCEKLKKARPRDTILNVGIGFDEATEADFYQFPEAADGLSTFSAAEAEHWETVGMGGKKFKVERVVKMPLLAVNRVIAEYFTECPDFVSIDVEGWDLQILKTLDFELYNPAVFCVETLAYRDDGSTYRLDEVTDFFASKGYFAFAETYANTIFVNRNLYDFHQHRTKQTNF